MTVPLSPKLPLAHLFQTNVLLCPKQQPPLGWKCGLSFWYACKPPSFGLRLSWVYGVGWPWLWEIVGLTDVWLFTVLFSTSKAIDHIALFVLCLLVFDMDKFTSKSIYRLEGCRYVVGLKFFLIRSEVQETYGMVTCVELVAVEDCTLLPSCTSLVFLAFGRPN